MPDETSLAVATLSRPGMGPVGPARPPWSRRRAAVRAFTRNRLSLIGLGLAALLAIVALAAPLLAPDDPIKQAVTERLAAPSGQHWFGTDNFGRDIFSRVLYGTRISLLVGLSSVLLGGVIGSLLGLIAGFRGGWTERCIMQVMDVLLAFPDLITGLVVMAVLGGGLRNLIIAIAISIVPRFARFAHAPTLSERQKDYVTAAEALGASDRRIMLRHVRPNISGELLVLASLWIATAIRIEANLSFVGLGVAPPTATWGQMIRDGLVYIQAAPLFSLVPGLAVFVTVLAFNLLGDGLSDAFDPRRPQ
ncbi:MAG TPA: ABC transporter permease [Mycobacteriales bacterium]|nr:ABC transporter permease [Mycobacteriales bacterium]